MVINATFNNISITLWPSVLLEEETGVPRENHRPAASHWQALSNNVVGAGFDLTTFVVIGTCSCKSNYHTITTMATPLPLFDVFTNHWVGLGLGFDLQ